MGRWEEEEPMTNKIWKRRFHREVKTCVRCTPLTVRTRSQWGQGHSLHRKLTQELNHGQLADHKRALWRLVLVSLFSRCAGIATLPRDCAPVNSPEICKWNELLQAHDKAKSI